MFFGSSRHAEGEEKVLRYVIHRINKEARLHDVIREDYVRRNCSRSEINRIINDPELVHACRERLWWTFKSGELDPSPRRRPSQPSTDGSPADGEDVSGPASPDA
jgi:hypothetical protein